MAAPSDDADPDPPGPTLDVVLRDGTVVEVRAMSAADEGRLERFHGTLSAGTTYLRYFSPHPQLSASELHRFTHGDHRDREAVVALVDDEIVGVARFDRPPEGPEAEVAFVVSDAWQGRGLGTALFRHLADRAVAAGVQRFAAETLPHNRPMLAVFTHAGLPHRTRFANGVVEIVIDLVPS
jgi:RimJ/RimL family protein N-acetyltransferase